MLIIPDAQCKGISERTVYRNERGLFCCARFRIRALMKVRDQKLQFAVSIVNDAGCHNTGCISYVGDHLCPVYGPLIFQFDIIRSDHVYVNGHGRILRHNIVISFIILAAVNSYGFHRLRIVRECLRPDTACVGIKTFDRHICVGRSTGGIPHNRVALGARICEVGFPSDQIDINTLEVSLPFRIPVCQEGSLFQLVKEDHFTAYCSDFLNITDIVGVFSSDQ